MPAALWPDEFVHGLVAQGLRVISFDNRDSGGSTRLEGVRIPSVPMAIVRALLRLRVRAPYTLDDMAADTAGLLDAIGVERCHVVGASMGGMIAQVLTARSPAKVASLTSIMSSTGNPARRIAFGTRRALRAILKPPPASNDIAAVVDHLVEVFGVIGSPGFRPEIPELRRYLERAARRGLYREGSSRQLLAILASGDRRAQLRALRPDAGHPRSGRPAGPGGGRPRHRREHPRLAARDHRGHGARLSTHPDGPARGPCRRSLLGGTGWAPAGTGIRARGCAPRRTVIHACCRTGGGVRGRIVTDAARRTRTCTLADRRGRYVGTGHSGRAWRVGLTQPLLRRPAAIPLMVRWIPRRVRSSRSPPR
jgi:pimeloyl-ACP methyl ester carboxylesterase